MFSFANETAVARRAGLPYEGGHCITPFFTQTVTSIHVICNVINKLMTSVMALSKFKTKVQPFIHTLLLGKEICAQLKERLESYMV